MKNFFSYGYFNEFKEFTHYESDALVAQIFCNTFEMWRANELSV